MIKKKRYVTAVFISVLAIMVGICAAYLSDFYHADMDAIAVFETVNPVERDEVEDGIIVFRPENKEYDEYNSEEKTDELTMKDAGRAGESEKTDTGLIFYPGGKVEYTAYEPLMEACASEGILCVLLEMPFHLAVLDMNAAKGIWELFPTVEEWYIGGHSLGGSMAASHLSKNTEKYEGLVLLGSYSTADLSGSDIEVLSVYGSEDGVMNREKYEENLTNLPEDFTELVIDGGCHAGFGMYGAQEGDGVPSITGEEQIRMTADAIAELTGNDRNVG